MGQIPVKLLSVLDAESDKLLACVHCGLCLEACPTYVVTGDENNSPRGRIYLMRAVEEGRLAADSKTFERYINHCLGCRACEPACPAGVEYGQLLEAARGELNQSKRPRALQARLLHLVLRHLWRQPKRLRLAFALARLIRDARFVRLILRSKVARLISPRMEFALALLDSSGPSGLTETTETDAIERASDTNVGPADRRVSIFKGCVMDSLFRRINDATRRVLKANGLLAVTPEAQGCCGALHAHAGDLEGARELARKNIEAFECTGETPVVTNAGGCGAMLVSYAHLLADDPAYKERAAAFSRRVRDVSQQLEVTGIRRGAGLGGVVATYDASCHLIYGQRAGDAPLKMLRAIPELKLAPLEGSERCCGGAGIYNLLEPEMSAKVLGEKLACLRKTGADLLATGNPGCHMQIAAGARLSGANELKVCHPVELLDESYRRAGFYQR
jgi:glycolate oxidase iron-sulfur subunit